MNSLDTLKKLIREEIQKAIKSQINEEFASPILRKLLKGTPGKNSYSSGYTKEIAQAFYNMTKVALDKVEDKDITKMLPLQAYKTMKNLVNHIVNEYLKFEKHCEENNLDKDNEELYRTWLGGIADETKTNVEAELLALCEDNEEMKEAIKGWIAEQ